MFVCVCVCGGREDMRTKRDPPQSLTITTPHLCLRARICVCVCDFVFEDKYVVHACVDGYVCVCVFEGLFVVLARVITLLFCL